MDYIKIRFGEDFDQLSSDLERTVEGMFRSMSPMFSLSERNWIPQMDMFETPDEIVVRAEVAGVDKENLEVEISSKALKIYGSRSERPCVENSTYRLAEIQYGKFERILYLPSPINELSSRIPLNAIRTWQMPHPCHVTIHVTVHSV